jgi:hypothetical protein
MTNPLRIDDLACGVCGKQAVMFFVHGARCDEHRFHRNPSTRLEGDGFVGCVFSCRTNAPAIAEASVEVG